MITVVCWRWAPPKGYRSTFGPETVNALRRMVARHYAGEHRFVCVTNDTKGIDPEVTILPDFGDFAGIQSPHGERNPSCYRRLRLFHPDAAQWFGDRFVSLDLDVVITGDLAPVFDRREDFVIWGDTNPTTLYNGSLVLMSAGVRPKVWTTFDPIRSPRAAKAAGCFGSDQGWISFCLGRGESKFSRTDGVYSFRNDLKAKGRSHLLPANARIVVFHGQVDPWMPAAQALPWVRKHYDMTKATA
jgi:hypothetical protein